MMKIIFADANRDSIASHGDLGNWNFLRRKLKALPPKVLRPERLLTGHDLMKLGFKEGRKIGAALKLLEEQQLEGTIRTKAQALKWVSKASLQ